MIFKSRILSLISTGNTGWQVKTHFFIDIWLKNVKLRGILHELTDEIIERLLPDQLTDIPASFTMIGHIAHFNLRDEYLPYKYLIGQVILEVISSSRFVL
jgi:tRNA G37 N-methylase Trm5